MKTQVVLSLPQSPSSHALSDLERELLWQMKAAKIQKPIIEFKFHKENKRYKKARRWRADFCWPEKKLIVEVEGGIFTNGRHVRGKGYETDCEKYNEAQMMGFTVLRVTGKHIKTGQALAWIEDFLKQTKKN